MGTAAHRAPLVHGLHQPRAHYRRRSRAVRSAKGLEHATQCRLADLAQRPRRHPALAVDHDGRGDGLRRQGVREEQLESSVAIDHIRVVHTEGIDEGACGRVGVARVEARRTARPGQRAPPPPATSTGASARHGAHHEAQTLRTTTSPRWSDSRNCSPSRVVPTRSGAAHPLVLRAGPPGSRRPRRSRCPAAGRSRGRIRTSRSRPSPRRQGPRRARPTRLADCAWPRSGSGDLARLGQQVAGRLGVRDGGEAVAVVGERRQRGQACTVGCVGRATVAGPRPPACDPDRQLVADQHGLVALRAVPSVESMAGACGRRPRRTARPTTA